MGKILMSNEILNKVLSLSLIDDVQKKVLKHFGANIVIIDHPDNFDKERSLFCKQMIEHLDLAEKKTPNDNEIIFKSNFLKAQVYGCYQTKHGFVEQHKKAIKCYERLLKLAIEIKANPAIVFLKYGIFALLSPLIANEKAIQFLNYVIKIEGKNSEKGIFANQLIQNFTSNTNIDNSTHDSAIVKGSYTPGIISYDTEAYEATINTVLKEIKEYSDKLTADPNNINLLLNRAILYYSISNIDQALEDYDRIISIDPLHLDALIGKGSCLNDMCQYKRAIEIYTSVIKRNPNLYHAYMNRGNTYGNMGKYDQALHDQTKAIELFHINENTNTSSINNPTIPTKAECYYNRAVTYDKIGLFEQVIEDCTIALKIDPFMHNANFKMGNAYLNLRLFEKAIDEYKKVITVHPNNIDALYNIGICFYSIEELESAISYFEKAAQLGDNEAKKMIQKLKETNNQ